MKNLNNLSNFKLALLSGILTGLSYPPTGMGFLAWFSLVPLFIIWMRAGPGSVAVSSFIAAIVSNLLSVYWIAFNSGTNLLVAFTSMMAVVLYLGLWWMGAGYLFAKIRLRNSYRLVLIPLIWVVMEWIRGYGPLGFPWLDLALTQTYYLPLIQSADLFGTSGIGFYVVALNVGFYLLSRPDESKIRPALFVTSLLITGVIFGYTRLWMVEKEENTKSISIVVTQPNINPVEKWEPEKRDVVFNTMFTLLDSALNMGPDLVLWPESALPAHLRLSGNIRNQILRKLSKKEGRLLTGTPDYVRTEAGNVQYYNATIYLEPGRKAEIYRKIKLVPFGEYIPLSPLFPSLKKLNFGQANFIPGDKYTVFNIGSAKISNVICYESSFPAYIAEFRKSGAELLTIQANDGWLGNSSGPYQHFQLAVLRAVENRMSIVRAANTGISGYILPSGRTGYQAKLNKMDLFLASVPVTSQVTLFSAYPTLFPFISMFIIICILVIAWIQKK